MPLFIAHSGGTDRIYSIPADTAGGAAAVEHGSFTLPDDLTNPQALAVVGDSLVCADLSGSEIFWLPANTTFDTQAVATKRITYPRDDIGIITGLAIVGDNIYAVTSASGEIYVLPLNTADGDEATYTSISAGLLAVEKAMATDGTFLYINDPLGISVFNLTSSTRLRRFDRPSGITDVRSMAINGNDLYLGDNSGDEVGVIPADTADDATPTASRIFDLPSFLLAPFGMVFYSAEAVDPPGDPSNVAVTHTHNTASVTFDAGTGTIDSYEYKLGTADWVDTGSDSTTINLTGLDPETQYSIQVRSKNTGGNKQWNYSSKFYD